MGLLRNASAPALAHCSRISAVALAETATIGTLLSAGSLRMWVMTS